MLLNSSSLHKTGQVLYHKSHNDQTQVHSHLPIYTSGQDISIKLKELTVGLFSNDGGRKEVSFGLNAKLNGISKMLLGNRILS